MSFPKKIFILTFIALNLVSMFNFLLPQESKFVDVLLAPVRGFNRFVGIHSIQNYEVLPSDRADRFMTALIYFKDRTTTTYEFGYLPEPLPTHTAEDIRFRNLTSFVPEGPGPAPLWRDMAKFALKKIHENSNKKPVRVEIHRHWAQTPPMENEFFSHEHLKNQFKSAYLYTYENF